MQLFHDFSDDNGNKDVPIWDYLGFSHAIHLLLEVLKYHSHCGESPTL